MKSSQLSLKSGTSADVSLLVGKRSTQTMPLSSLAMTHPRARMIRAEQLYGRDTHDRVTELTEGNGWRAAPPHSGRGRPIAGYAFPEILHAPAQLGAAWLDCPPLATLQCRHDNQLRIHPGGDRRWRSLTTCSKTW